MCIRSGFPGLGLVHIALAVTPHLCRGTTRSHPFKHTHTRNPQTLTPQPSTLAASHTRTEPRPEPPKRTSYRGTLIPYTLQRGQSRDEGAGPKGRGRCSICGLTHQSMPHKKSKFGFRVSGCGFQVSELTQWSMQCQKSKYCPVQWAWTSSPGLAAAILASTRAVQACISFI